MTDEQKPSVACPICNMPQVTKYSITEQDDVTKCDWFHCFCGSIFHDQGIDPASFDEAYLKNWQDKKGVDIRTAYTLKTYLPLFEEMIYGRKFLDVGFTVPHMILEMQERGWIATGIDLIKNDFITDDFETFTFEDKFDFIHMGHVLESFSDIQGALKKAYNMLNRDGILFISHPAPELVYNVGLQKFGAWNSKYVNIFVAEKELKRLALGTGFEWILSRINFSQRFVSWNDRHIILQKKY